MNKLFNYTKITTSLFLMLGCVHTSYASEHTVQITKFGQSSTQNSINYNNSTANNVDELGILLNQITHEQNIKSQQTQTNYKPMVNHPITPNKTTSVAVSTPAPQPKSYIVYDYHSRKILDYKNPHMVLPIASVTKLMTAYTFLSLNKDPNCTNQITDEDTDTLKGTRTRLPKYTDIPCHDLLKAMLVGSDNYAASSLARAVRGYSKPQFIHAMNTQAKAFGMHNTHFKDSSGLSPQNVSTVSDLLTLSVHALNNRIISNITSFTKTYANPISNSPYRTVAFNNTNKLIRNGSYSALLSKTGYISEAGYNLVFVNGKRCQNGLIGVISLNNSSSENRARFTMSKLVENGCF